MKGKEAIQRTAMAWAGLRRRYNQEPTRVDVPQRTLSLATIAAGGLLILLSAWVPWLFLAISWFTTWGHEMCHAIIGIATGAKVSRITILASGNGATDTYGGLKPLISWAGYPGGLLWGAVLWRLADRARGWLIFATGSMVAMTALLLAKDRMTSTVLLAILVLIGVPRLLPWNTVAAVWMKLLGAVVFIFGWWRILGLLVLDTPSDSQILESLTGVSHTIWIQSWVVTGILITIWLTQSEVKAWRNPWNGANRRALWDGADRRAPWNGNERRTAKHSPEEGQGPYLKDIIHTEN